MADIIKFTDEELEQIKRFQDEINAFIYKFGQTDLEIINLQTTLENLQGVRDTLQTEYLTIMRERQTYNDVINNKYGPGSLELATGIFTPTIQ